MNFRPSSEVLRYCGNKHPDNACLYALRWNYGLRQLCGQKNIYVGLKFIWFFNARPFRRYIEKKLDKLRLSNQYKTMHSYMYYQNQYNCTTASDQCN